MHAERVLSLGTENEILTRLVAHRLSETYDKNESTLA